MFKNYFTKENIIILIILIIVIYLILKDSKSENFISYDRQNIEYKICNKPGGPCFPDINGNKLYILGDNSDINNKYPVLINYCEKRVVEFIVLISGDYKCQSKPLLNEKDFWDYVVQKINNHPSKLNMLNKLIWMQFIYIIDDEKYREAWNLYHIDISGNIYDLTNDGTYFSIRFPYYSINKQPTTRIGNIANDSYFKPYIQLYESDKENKLDFYYYKNNTRIQIKDIRDNRFKDLRFNMRKIGQLTI